MEAANDQLVYEFYELGAPEHPGDIAFGTSIVYPGTVGEYFMTTGISTQSLKRRGIHLPAG